MSVTIYNSTVELNQTVEKQIAAAMAISTTRMVEFLASEYGFDASEAIQRLGLHSVTVNRSTKKKAAPKADKVPKEKRLVPSIPLPFCGIIKEDWCCGIRLNHGLYSQCTMPKGNDTDFCKTCVKQVEKNENNKPTYGVIQDRMSVGPMEFRDPKGKAVVCYGNIMAKLKIGKVAAIAEAAKFGLVIEDEQFEERKAVLGRPKKETSVSEIEKPKKKLGRPRRTAEELEAANVRHEALQAEITRYRVVPQAEIYRERVPCLCCSKTYASMGGLRQHMNKHHSEPGTISKYVCGFCDRVHACRSNLERHEISCKKNPDAITAGSAECEFKCDVCGHGFKQKINMISHRFKKHTNSYPPVCGNDNVRCSHGTIESCVR